MADSPARALRRVGGWYRSCSCPQRTVKQPSWSSRPGAEYRPLAVTTPEVCMKSGLVLVGAGMFVVGLAALFFGIMAMVSEPCSVGGDCTPGIGASIIGFPIGLGLVIIGSIVW